MSELNFSFQEFLNELQAIRQIAKPFICPDSFARGLPRLATVLQNIRSLPYQKKAIWDIPDHSPLYTNVSCGNYEPDSNGEHNIVGAITSVWEVAPSDPNATNKKLAKTFRLIGNASVRIRLLEWGEQGLIRELGMWRMEIGDEVSPGCHFHVQVLGENNNPPFPHSLPIPRLPSFAFTPMSALEFLIAELFQDGWKAHSAKETSAMKMWRGIQRRRIERLLNWKKTLIKDAIGSPWTVLKKAKPSSDLFLKDHN